MKKNKQKNKKSIIYLVVLLLTVCLTVGFSAFQNELFISDMLLKVRLQRDVRVSNSVISKTSGSVVNSEEYNKTKLLGNVTFDSTSSYVLYRVDLANYGNVKSGLLDITGASGLNVSICDSNAGNCTSDYETPICNGSNCTLGSTKEIYVKVSPTSSGTKNINLDLDIEPYVNITYDNIRENTNSFRNEVLETSTYQLTLTSKPEEVEVSGNATVNYNKSTGVLVLSNIEGDLNIQGKYLINTIAETSYTGSNPNNYVKLGNDLYRIVTKETVEDGYGNSEFRTKITKETSIGKYIYDESGGTFDYSYLKTVLNEDYYNSLSETQKSLIDTVKWKHLIESEDVLDGAPYYYSTAYFALIEKENYNDNSSWLNKDQFVMGISFENGDVDLINAIVNGSLDDKYSNEEMDTYPTTYLRSDVLVIGGSGTSTDPYILDLSNNGLQPNPTIISRKSLTVTGSNQELVTVTSKVGTPYYSIGTQLNSSNYSSGSTTIPSRSDTGRYTIYYYIPAEGAYKAKAGSVTSIISGLTFTIAYQKGNNVSVIGKTSDSCTTSGSNLSCSVTLPSITPGTGYENGKWSDGTNTYNPGATYTLSSNGKALTATVTGKTYVATFNKNGADSVGSASISCTVTTGSNCSVTAPSITRSGYTIIGWNTSASAQTGTAVNTSITLTGNATYNAITKKDVTVTFYKNGNYSQVPSGGTFSEDDSITQSCTMWNTATSCNITSPKINPAYKNSIVLGYSTGAETYSNYWTHNTSKSFSSNASYYAQSKVEQNVKFHANGAVLNNNSSLSYVENTCLMYNSGVRCSIEYPTVTRSGYTFIGWNTEANGETSSSVFFTNSSQMMVEPDLEVGYDPNSATTPLTASIYGDAYAITSKNVTTTFHYNSNTTSGSFTDATTTSNCTLYNTSTNCTVSIPSQVSSSVGKYNSSYKGLSSSNTTITNVATPTAGQTYYAYYSSPVTIYYPSSTTARGSYSYYRNEYYNSATSMNSVINSSQTSTTNFTFSSSVTDYILYGFANSAGTNTKNYDNIAALANSDKTSNYAILYKSVPVTFYYNSDTSSGTFAGSNAMANANQYLRCTSTASELSNSNITIPQIVSGSVGKYNSAYKGVHTSLSNMGSVTPTTANTAYYANYSSPVTNYYYGTSYTNRTLYRNEFLTTADAIASRLATSNTSTSNYSTATGPGSSVWSGLSEAADTIAEYSTIQHAADSSSNTLYTIYQFNITYQKGSNISSIGATSGNCKVTTSSTACNVVLPSITPVAGYNSVGWNTSSGATSGTSAGSNYSLNTNGRTLYANASIMYKCPASKTENITWGSEAASAYGNYTSRCQTSWHSSLGTFQDLNNHSVCGSNRICTTYDAGGGMYCCNDCTCRMFDFDGCVEDKSCTVYTCPTNITYTINWGEPSLTKYGDYQSECVAYSNVTMYQCPTSGTLIYGNYGGKQTAKYGSYQAQCTSSTEQNSLCGVSSSETYDTCNWTPRCPEEGNCYDVLDANGNREMTCCKCTRVNYKSCTLYNCPTTVTTGAPWTYGSWQTAKYGSYQSACISNQ